MRIGIANDQDQARECIRQVILSVPGYEVAWEARDGLEAVKKCAADPPDLVLMEMIMPVMNGVEATRRIMKNTPCPVLVVCATPEAKVSMVFEAMGFGALDVVNTPTEGRDLESEKNRRALRRKIGKIASLTTSDFGVGHPGLLPSRYPRQEMSALVVLGASTGGPAALADVLSALPANIEAGFVIVQHVDEAFSAGLAEWLNGQTRLEVVLAAEGICPQAGKVYLAASNDHLILNAGHVFAYTAEPCDYPFRPSIDTFFMSAALQWPRAGVAALLTGMGKDGAAGLRALRDKGWHTIAQDEQTSVVYGMPKAAREVEAAVEILPIQEIAPSIVRNLKLRMKTGGT
ncbi:MAG: chemotaxis response regulator protein-glutamate methylesterase [Syntrophobacteraceae bacterium]